MSEINNKEYTEDTTSQDLYTRASFRKAARDKKERNRGIFKEILSWILCLFTAVFIALILRTYVFEFVKVDGDSMLPTLKTGDTVFVEKFTKLSDDGLNYNDIVIVHYPKQDNKAFVKRIVGLPGDTVSIKDGLLYVNGEPVYEDFTYDSEINEDMAEYTIPDEHYFVMGDNRNNSLDSRSVGSIHKNEIVGHAMFIIWPVNEIKSLD